MDTKIIVRNPLKTTTDTDLNWDGKIVLKLILLKYDLKMHLAQDNIQWRDSAYTEINLRFRHKIRNFFCRERLKW
jgi:hypothetical protein